MFAPKHQENTIEIVINLPMILKNPKKPSQNLIQKIFTELKYVFLDTFKVKKKPPYVNFSHQMK
jgi:hypothetical protein